MDIQIRQQDEMRTAAIRHMGPYWKIGEAFGKIAAWAKDNGIPLEKNLVGIYHDSPDETPEAELRSDACVIVPAGMAVEGDSITEVRIPAGTYAVAIHVGSYEGLGQSWGQFMGELPATGYRADGAAMEIYLEDCAVTPVEQVRTEMCIPVTR